VSPVRQAKNLLPTGEDAGDIKLLFRAYNPSAALVKEIGQVKLPKVVKENCR
jgi:hypothetical protein